MGRAVKESRLYDWLAVNRNKEGASVLINLLRDMGVWEESDEAEIANARWRFDNDDSRRDGMK